MEGLLGVDGARRVLGAMAKEECVWEMGLEYSFLRASSSRLTRDLGGIKEVREW